MADPETKSSTTTPFGLTYYPALYSWIEDNVRRYGDAGGGRQNPSAVPVDKTVKTTPER
jgi:hypothetical protein